LKATVNIIKDIVNSISANIVINAAISNGDGTYTVYSTNTWWLSKDDIITIGTDDYRVNSFIQNEEFTITPTGTGVLPTAANFDLQSPTYIHGTLKMAKNEVNAIKNKMGLVPFIYLYEVLRDKKNTDASSAIDRETTLRIFFLNTSSFKDMLTEDVYLNILDPLQSMFDLFITKLKQSKYFTYTMDYDNIPLVNFSEEGNQQKSIFDVNLSGIEMRLNAEIRKDLSGCRNYVPPNPPSCANGNVVNSDSTYSLIVPSGETETLPDITHTDSDLTPVILPAQTPMICTPQAPFIDAKVYHSAGSGLVASLGSGDSYNIPKHNILKSDLSLIESKEFDENSTISDSEISNSDNSYLSSVKATETKILPDININKSDSTLIETIPSVKDYNVGDSTVKNSDDSYSDVIKATDTLILPDILFTDSDGSTSSIPSVKDISATPCPVKSGIAYQRPEATGQYQSFQDGDDGWHKNNGTYDYTPPEYPLYRQTLDHTITNANNFNTLFYPNEFGNYNRFTDPIGGSDYSTHEYAIDHLTRLAYYYYTLSGLDWSEAISTAHNSTSLGYTDWRIPSALEARTLWSAYGRNRGFNIITDGSASEDYLTSTTRYDLPTYAMVAGYVYGGGQLIKTSNSIRAVMVRNHYI